jgi:hypothetical protein
MAFASREDDYGVWRLCIRRGRLIKEQEILNSDGTKHVMDIGFSTYLKAKACSDELNKDLFPEYEKYVNRDNLLKDPNTPVPQELINKIMDVVVKHITDDQLTAGL